MKISRFHRLFMFSAFEENFYPLTGKSPIIGSNPSNHVRILSLDDCFMMHKG